MNYRIYIRPAAESDLLLVQQWYEGQREGLGEAFYRSVESCLSQISRMPASHPRVSGIYRKALLRRFPYHVYYFVNEDEVIVIGVFHTMRNPRAWRKRI